jgi:diacylglycerol kinase (ATP)
MLTADMKPPVDIRVIINPASAARRTAGRISAITASLEHEFPGRCRFALTRAPGDAEELARRAVEDSVSLLVCVGGDGTLNEVINGMLAASGGTVPETSLGLISSGSGQGFAQSVRLPGALQEQVGLLRACPGRPVDLGAVTVQDGSRGCGTRQVGWGGQRTRQNSSGGWRTRYFINECQVGIGADVVRGSRDLGKWAGGLISYGLATVAAIFRSPNVQTTLSIDGTEADGTSLLGLCVGNGDLTGGGMSLTPGAEVDDGLLNLLTIHGLSLAGRLRSFPRIYTGRHITLPGFSHRTVKQCAVDGPVPLPVAADGEEIGRTPCQITIVERALMVILPDHQERL